ncbi:DUF2924 domain-containing protein [Hyphomicrobium sp. MC1]|uniref:DUF2924 domain-containing protein n=1 Tax=Hyphomicrobium sp. (strain MC1) TaxID=717785 RepID=UPI000213F80C|nr:DUF2924 domain-containing protein [Hyphomicrobium sp. MC1]CCB63360.1 conserved protein of unknown function [Hyphomicrobium sp. MC1]
MSRASDQTSNAVATEVAALASLSHRELRLAWRQYYKAYPPKFVNRTVIELGVAWKIQERAFGGLGTATKRQLDALADELEIKSDITRPKQLELRPGARLVRDWRGETHEVVVTEDGFLWRGQSWRSLSLIAKEITGTHWSGPRFFGLASERNTGGVMDE